MVKSVKLRGLLLLLALALSIPSSGAQNNSQQSTQQRPPTQSTQWGATPKRAAAPEEYKPIRLDRDVALPLPGYTGKQVFLHGLQYPNAVGGAGYMVVYNTEHTPTQVKEWWTNALKSDPWKIEVNTSDTVKAMSKDGSKCTIMVAARASAPPERLKGMNGSYTVYFQARQLNR